MNHRATLFLLAYQLVSIHVVNAWTSTSTFSYLKTTHSKQHKQTSTSSYLPSSSSSSEDYSVVLGLPPLGIVFEDISSGYPPKGVEVVALTTGGKGANCGKIEIGDQLKVCYIQFSIHTVFHSIILMINYRSLMKIFNEFFSI